MVDLPRDRDDQLSSFTDLGGYPLFYITQDNSVICPQCANNLEQLRKEIEAAGEEWVEIDNEKLVKAEINYEDPDLYCDNCSQRIESAYAEPEVEG